MLEEPEGGIPEEQPADVIEQTEIIAEPESQDDPEEAGEGDQSDPGADSEDLVEILLGDKTETLSKAEIAKRMMLHADYTRKTQEIAENVRQAASREHQWDADVALTRQAIASNLDQMKGWAEFFHANQPVAPDFVAMAKEKGPGVAYQAELAWRETQGKLDQARAMYDGIVTQQNETSKAEFVASIRRDFPEWRDQAVQTAETDAIHAVALAYGFSPNDVVATQDVRVLKALRDLARLTATQAKRPEIARKVADVMKTTPVRAAPANGDARRAQEGRRAFEKNPTADNAAKYLDF